MYVQQRKAWQKQVCYSVFILCIAAFPGNLFYRLGQVSALSEFLRRSFYPILQSFTRMYPWRELGRSLCSIGQRDGFPDIDAQVVADHRQLVGESNVYITKTSFPPVFSSAVRLSVSRMVPLQKVL